MKRKSLSFLLAVTMVASLMTGTLPAKAASPQIDSYKELKSRQENSSDYKEGQAIVLYKAGVASSKKTAAKALDLDEDIKVENFWEFDTPEESGNEDYQVMSADNTLSVGLVSSKTLSTKQLIKKLENQENVEMAEPNYRVKIAATNDAYSSWQWPIENVGQNAGTAGTSTNISEKWKTTKGSDDVVVAVVDTGVDYTHEDLKDNIWENTYQPALRGEHGFDFMNGDSDPMDDNGHGSHCAGIIGAKGENGTGISGVNQNVKIMALKTLDEDGYGYESEEIYAYHYINKALNLGVNIVAINNSWGGGDESEIFEKLMNLVGEKGAVSVCAAGNEAMDNDEVASYPSNVATPYKITVAATNEKDELAYFSNYGKNSVDIAAPGTDILSTVSYNCYNPSLYDGQKQKEVSEKFNDFEGTVSEDLAWDIIPKGEGEGAEFITSVPELGTDRFHAEITEDSYFGSSKGHSLKLSFDSVKKNECVGIKIPYTLNDTKKTPIISVMAKPQGPDAGDEASGSFIVADVPAGIDVAGSLVWLLMEVDPDGIWVNGKTNDWTHFAVKSGEVEESNDRALVMMFIADADGDYSVCLDDIGKSLETADESQFGKYDFYSGTSMATPHVTGALALEAAENPEATAEERMDQVLGHARSVDALSGKVGTGATLDFSKKTAAGPRIGDVTVDTANGQIILKGSGLDAEDLSVKITCNEEEKEAQVVEHKKSTAILSDDGWINQLVTITISGNGKTQTKKDIYLVKGKKEYAEEKDTEFFDAETMATDGNKIYSVDSDSDSIEVMNLAEKDYRMFDTCMIVKPANYFTEDENSLGDYDFSFGKDLVYMDGKLYNIASYGEVSPESDWDDWDDDDEDWRNTKASSADDWDDDDDDWDDDDDEDDWVTGVAYSAQYKLFCYDTKTRKLQDLGELPEDTLQREDWTLAGYNGNLYLIGGYDYSKKDLSTAVKVYSPSKKTWSDGVALPEGRAKGKAIQSGNKLVYTLGCSKDKTCSATMTFDGSKWTVSKQKMEPYQADKAICGSTTYDFYTTSVGLCKEGVIYAGMKAKGLGDTFIYNVEKDEYQPTEYCLSTTFDDDMSYTGIAAGDALYVCDDAYDVYKADINSGLVSVTAKKMSQGTITNANKKFLPGTLVTISVQPKKGYGVKAFYLNGKKVDGTSKKFRLTSNMSATASFGKAVTKIKLSKTTLTLKAGGSYKLKASVLPKNAASKKVTYKSSNTKYATVSSSGVIKANKAGRGKKVTITVTATDGSNKTAKCTVKIK